ncbi:MAG TPA: DoxX family protein [Edaphocola sp.]|nr:DoxX family protein [Edaphocola sp.]
MPTIKLFSLLLMAAIYCFAGISHFLKPSIFLKITPKWVPYPKKVNLLIGGVELVLGIALLFSMTRSFAAIGIIALLIAVFPANIYHFQLAVRKRKFVFPTLMRLPIQILLIYWAYTFI